MRGTESPVTEDEGSITNSTTTMDVLTQLKAFRQAAYDCLGKAHDATFELTDAVLLTRTAYCLADFSQCPVFRRKWSSIYKALQDCRPQRQKLMQLYIKQMLRCSDATTARRRDDHKEVAYFASRGKFWSPKYGELTLF